MSAICIGTGHDDIPRGCAGSPCWQGGRVTPPIRPLVGRIVRVPGW